MGAISKSGLSNARSCPERGHRELVLGERPPVAAQPSLAVYRAKTAFLNTVNRLLQRGSAAAERAVAVLWADA